MSRSNKRKCSISISTSILLGSMTPGSVVSGTEARISLIRLSFTSGYLELCSLKNFAKVGSSDSKELQRPLLPQRIDRPERSIMIEWCVVGNLSGCR